MKQTKFTLFIAFFLLFIFYSCVSTIPMNQDFYNSKKVGIVLEVEPIGIYKAGAQGLLDMALTPGNKFEKPLKSVETRLEFEQKLKTEISNILSNKNKNHVI